MDMATMRGAGRGREQAEKKFTDGGAKATGTTEALL
jgi:hypothetical protein